MLIAKRLRPLLPDASSLEQESPVLASPDVSTAPCDICHTEYTPLLYRFPGVTKSQHNHPNSGGIYCTTRPNPQLGTATALGRTIGTIHIDSALGHIAMVRADAVNLIALYIHCAVCGRLTVTGAVTLTSHRTQPAFVCNTCLTSALAHRHTPTGWLFRATPTDLSWCYTASPSLPRSNAASPPLPRSTSREPAD